MTCWAGLCGACCFARPVMVACRLLIAAVAGALVPSLLTRITDTGESARALHASSRGLSRNSLATGGSGKMATLNPRPVLGRTSSRSSTAGTHPIDLAARRKCVGGGERGSASCWSV